MVASLAAFLKMPWPLICADLRPAPASNSFHAPAEYLKTTINKKFFIQKLILIFVPLQKIRLRKHTEKLSLKQFLYQL